MRKSMPAIAILVSLTACGQKPAEPEVQNTSKAVESAPATSVEPPPETANTMSGFNKEFDLQGVHFVVEASSNGSINTLSIIPSGLKGSNDAITREIDGTVTNAEVNDLNADGSPEIYVFTQSAGSGSYGTVIGYAVNDGKSLSEIYFPSVADDPKNSAGYMGHDEFYTAEGTLAQRFPIYNSGDTNATPTGKSRQLQYKLKAGEAGWVLKLDRAIEY